MSEGEAAVNGEAPEHQNGAAKKGCSNTVLYLHKKVSRHVVCIIFKDK